MSLCLLPLSTYSNSLIGTYTAVLEGVDDVIAHLDVIVRFVLCVAFTYVSDDLSALPTSQ